MRPLRVLALAAAALIGTGAAVAGISTVAGAAPAGTVICDQFGSTASPDGRYIVQNNRWGTSTQQCITVGANGFTLSTSNANVPTNGAPASYPSIYWGCHYANCTPGFTPIQASSAAFAGISTSVGMTYPGSGQWDAAYDIWFDPTARRDGQNTGAEIMVWLNHAGAPQPVGSRVATVSLAGGTWDVWEGNIGWNVVSYVRTAGAGSVSFPVSTFFTDAVSRGYAQTSWYLTSIQAGFEPWTGGTGLAVTSFSVTTGGGSTTPPPPPATTTPPPPTGASCTASYAVTQTWTGGFTADVTVRNTGRTTAGWTVTWTYGGTQQVTNAWSTALTQTGTAVRATNVDYNGVLAPSGTTTFGMQGTGSGPAPTLTCTAR
ncbi:MAG TPA: cellulose binding domain-containing protein [Mycobacteriales bacterium]